MSSFDPHQSGFWDEAELRSELDRVFDICHACRRCADLCPSFGTLFDAVDALGDGDVDGLTPLTRDRVADLCYQCKLCEQSCPYTEPHPFELDFPQLVLRARAVRARRDGLSRSERQLADPDAIGRAGVLLGPVANWARRSSIGRAALESMTGIDRRRRLPTFARQSFDEWFVTRRRKAATAASGRKVALFTTCHVDHHAPQIGRALVEILERNGCQVELPRQRCCGMPAMEVGDLERAIGWADQNIASLEAAIEAGADVVVPGPSCRYAIRHDYPRICSDRERARTVAERTFDATSYLLEMHRCGELDTAFAAPPQRIAFHLPCHARAQPGAGDGRSLLGLLDADVRELEGCAGMGATWGVRPANRDRSRQVAAPLAERLAEADDELVVTSCPHAAQQIEELRGLRPYHPIEVLAAAYSAPAPSP